MATAVEVAAKFELGSLFQTYERLNQARLTYEKEGSQTRRRTLYGYSICTAAGRQNPAAKPAAVRCTGILYVRQPYV